MATGLMTAEPVPAAGASLARLPLRFEAFEAEGRTQFLGRGAGAATVFTGRSVWIRLPGGGEWGELLRLAAPRLGKEPVAEPAEPLDGRTHYLFGNDRSRWRRGVSSYRRIRYREVLPGVDWVFYGKQDELEYDFVLAPHADPAAIELDFPAATSVRLDDSGRLLVAVPGGEVMLRRPVAYQMLAGSRRIVEARHRILGGARAGFELGDYRRDLPLVIDPVLSFSTFLGGVGDDAITAVATDGAGNIYVAGRTSSLDFPVSTGAWRTALSGGHDVFVTRLNPAATSIVYSTYIGGAGYDKANAIAVDAGGNVHLAGYSNSSGFPITSGAPGAACCGAFAVKLNATGSALSYSTFLGDGEAWAVAVDPAGSAYFAGSAGTAFQATSGAFQRAHGGATDAFLTKLNAAGTAIVYSTFLGGAGEDRAYGVAVDSAGAALVGGQTSSTNFPLSAGAFQTTRQGVRDGFLARLNSSGNALLYSTLVGGSGGDGIHAVRLDASGSAYAAGITNSTNLPATAGAFAALPPSCCPPWAFAGALNSTGTAFHSLTYAGQVHGDDFEKCVDLSIDSGGNFLVAGATQDGITATADAMQTQGAGGLDAFLLRLNASASSVLYATYAGGALHDVASALVVDYGGNAYLAGRTLSTGFPASAGALRPVKSQFHDGFLLKLSGAATACSFTLNPSSRNFAVAGGSGSFSINTGAACPWTAASNAAWITVDTAGMGTGPGTVIYSVAANSAPTARGGTITVSGQTFTVTQDGAACDYTVSPAAISTGYEGGFTSATVTAAAGCGWTAVSNAAWITISRGASGSGSGTVDYRILPNTRLARTASLTVASRPVTVSQSGGMKAPSVVFRATSGAVRLFSYGSMAPVDSTAAFAGDPSGAQNSAGDTFAVATDGGGALWASVRRAGAATWDSWAYGGGQVKGKPSAAATPAGVAYIAFRDNWNAYWLTSYTPGAGFGAANFLGGVFVIDPLITAAPDGSLYIAGKDHWNGMWASRFVPGSGLSGWQFGGGVVQGVPSISAGTDGVAYIAARDAWNSLWMARYGSAGWLGWSFGGGVMAGDPRVAAAGDGTIYAVLLDAGGGAWTRGYMQGTAGGWLGWNFTGGALQDFAVAGRGGALFLAGRDHANGIWWYTAPAGEWEVAASSQPVAGSLAAAPR